MPFDLSKEKLRCLIVLDDVVAGRLSCKAGPAYWRAFITEDRTTHRVHAEFRFKYDNGEKNWFRSQPKVQISPEATIEELRCGMEDIMKKGFKVFGIDAAAPENAIQCYYPPDDGGDPMKTIIWLEQQDLIEVTVETISSDRTDA
jgi:hypothetical protein